MMGTLVTGIAWRAIVASMNRAPHVGEWIEGVTWVKSGNSGRCFVPAGETGSGARGIGRGVSRSGQKDEVMGEEVGVREA